MNIFSLISDEKRRILNGINLIPSENYPSKNVMSAVSSVLTSKYAEGYPGLRYYSGCFVVDQVEDEVIRLAKLVFGAEHANVQPHSGSQANFAVLQALCVPGDIVLSMSMNAGGHLTHGHPKNLSGILYKFYFYGLTDIGQIDYHQLEDLAIKHRPKIIIAGGSSFPLLIDFSKIYKIAQSVGAVFWVDMAHFAGMVAAKTIPSPLPLADVVTTTTHKTLRGPRGGIIFCKKELAKKIDRAVMPGMQGGPAMNIIAGKGIALAEALTPEFVLYQKQVLLNAKALAEGLRQKGFCLSSGGTETHLLLIDLTKTPGLEHLTGAAAEKILETSFVFVNKNVIPLETRSPLVASGIRLGTPAITTLGAKEEQMFAIANLIDYLVRNDFKKSSESLFSDITSCFIDIF